ncbi:hypothetical protein ABZ793_06110 [Micromonospora sp. NPDC047465]|uniref:hypothetical protein n=1 Tax=Micromonospora sp. NPDC047465 TaxID=3154813 RepID=UPI0033C0F4DC
MSDDYQEVEIPLIKLARPYREQLEARTRQLDEQIEPLDRQHDEVYEKAQPKIEALEAALPPEFDDEQAPTAVEWLTRRAALIDMDVAIYVRDVAAAEAYIKYCKAIAERDEIELRVGQLDHFTEASDPVLSVGHDDQLAIWTLQAQESAIELASAETALQFARRRLEHAKKAQREIQNALRREKRSEEQAAKQTPAKTRSRSTAHSRRSDK